MLPVSPSDWMNECINDTEFTSGQHHKELKATGDDPSPQGDITQDPVDTQNWK